VKKAGELSVVEVGLCIASQDLLRMQLTMCVLEICLQSPNSQKNTQINMGFHVRFVLQWTSLISLRPL
jgi:hypothetical protein